jgi:peroxiredoxin
MLLDWQVVSSIHKMHLLEGRIWEDLGRLDRAQTAYALAFIERSDDARDALRDLHARADDDAPFQPWFDALIAETRAARTGGLPQAPDFNLTSIDGETLSLSALRGKAVVLNFWFIGCAPCRVEMPALNRLVEAYEGRDVVFIGIAFDDADALRAFRDEHEFNYTIVSDPDAAMSALYGAKAYPTHVVIDRQGRIISQFAGGDPDADESFKPLIDQALAR